MCDATCASPRRCKSAQPTRAPCRTAWLQGLFTTEISTAFSMSSSGHRCKLRCRSPSRGGVEASIFAVALWFWSQRRRRPGSGSASSAKAAATSLLNHAAWPASDVALRGAFLQWLERARAVGLSIVWVLVLVEGGQGERLRRHPDSLPIVSALVEDSPRCAAASQALRVVWLSLNVGLNMSTISGKRRNLADDGSDKQAVNPRAIPQNA